MRFQDAVKLHSGDEVYWNDPDNGACSRILKIRNIEVWEDAVSIEEIDGSVVECYIEELE